VFVGGVTNHPIAGSPVVIDGGTGELGVQASSVRFKKDIEPIGTASEAILALKPVAFRYKQKIDPKGLPQFGLVAEDVEKVNPDLVTRDREGKPYSVRCEAVNAMLLNEFLKEHRKVEQPGHKIQEQDATIAQLKFGMEALTAMVKEQASQLQKVSAISEHHTLHRGGCAADQ
jgi:hypothetical protein